MTDAWTSGDMSPELLKVAERAKRDPQGRFHSLAYLIDEAALARAFHRLRKEAAVGVDGTTKERYGQDLDEHLKDLHEQLKAGRYRHQPIRRVHIPKDKGKTRPIGISATPDKMVQGAIREVLEAVYEQDFLPCSFGFRPGRGAHDAIRTLNRAVHAGEVNWVLEADIRSFFDSIDRKQLLEMLKIRVADGSMLRLVGKCLHVGVLDGEEYSEPDLGTAQGSILSPLLGNIYLHYVLDLWFEKEVRPRLRGKAILLRYADDFLIGFELKDDAERVMLVLPKRMSRFGLTLHPEKNSTAPFPQAQRKGAWWRLGNLRLSWVHALLAADPEGPLGDVVQDEVCAPFTGHSGRVRLVSRPSTLAGQGAARRARETPPGPLPILRGQRQPTLPEDPDADGQAGLV